MDNPLVKFGSDVYQPNEPINLCYDTFAPAAALIRGLFEYLYRADGLTILPHLPPGISELEQRFPVRFGNKQIYLSAYGTGPITKVLINGKPWPHFDADSILLPYPETPAQAQIQIAMGNTEPGQLSKRADLEKSPAAPAIPADDFWNGGMAATLPKPDDLRVSVERIARFHDALLRAGLERSYEASHARLALEQVAVAARRAKLLSDGTLKPLPEPSGKAADKSYLDTAVKLCTGLEHALASYQKTDDPLKKIMYAKWNATAK